MTGHVRISFAALAAVVLGAVVLTPVFTGRFLFVSVFVCAAVTGAGILMQRWRAPRWLVTAVQFLVLAEVIALLFAKPTLKFGLVPWKDTVVAINDQFVVALDAINKYSAPLPPTDELTAFAASMIGLTGLLVHVIAVQIRQAAWAGLLLLMMYTVPAATVHDGLPALLFIPPALGYIILLSAEGRSRLSRWGRRISGIAQLDGAEPIEASALGQAGRRIGLTVIAVAALLPALLPSLPEGVFGTGISGSGSGGGGGGASVGRNPMVDMGENLRRGENVQALTYTGPGPTYLRLAALDAFDGREWRVAPRTEGFDVDGNFAPPPGLSRDVSSLEQLKYNVNVSKGWRSQWVPAPYPVRSLTINHKWRYHPATLDIQSASGRSVTGLKYTVTAYNVNPTEEELRNSLAAGAADDYTMALPRNVSTRIKRLAQQITASANGNPYEQAVLLQKYFRESGGFAYSLENSSGSGLPALEAFLFDDKTGYCEQFGTSMALLARTLGIPARVAIGFLPGQHNENGKYVVRTHDMHLWPELFFSGVGWVRFEPTPGSRSGRAPNWTEPVGGGPTANPTLNPTPTPTSTASNPDDPEHDPAGGGRDLNDDPEANDSGTAGWWSTNGPRWGAGLAVAVLVLCIPWMIRSLVRRRRFSRPAGRAGVEGLWAEIRDTSRDIGLTWSDTATPRQVGEWLRERLPSSAHPEAVRLARGVEAVRYAGPHGAERDLRAEATAVRRALWSTASRGSRWRARLLPPSWRWYLNRGSAEASDLLDQFDLALARLRSTLPVLRSR
jgi:transglutaminase-like putative cysteine protease